MGGSCVTQGISELTQIDGVTRIAEFVVVGNPEFATLVTGSPSELRERFARRDHSSAVLSHAVFVSDRDDAPLRALLAEHGMTAILGTEAAGETLHARLVAMLAADQSASDRLITEGTKVLTQVARRGGAPAVIAELAHRIDGWAVLLDANGQLITSAGAGMLHIDDAVAVALGRPVRVRHPGLQTHQVGTDRDRTGYLVIASRSSVKGRIRDLASQAAALFDLVLRTRDPSVTEGLGREALLDILLAGGQKATALLRRWGIHESGLTAFALGSRSRTVDLERFVSRWLDEVGEEHVYVNEPGLVRGFIPDGLADDLAARVGMASPGGTVQLALGLGLPAPADRLGRSAIEASQALETALADGRAVTRYARMPTVEFVLGRLGSDSTGQLASVLDGLRDEAGQHGELTETLRVFLREHGGHRVSAATLGIHRQTLSSRLRRIEMLTDLSLERADDRATAWLALRALGT